MELKSIALICHIRNYLIIEVQNNYVQQVEYFGIIQLMNLVVLDKVDFVK